MSHPNTHTHTHIYKNTLIKTRWHTALLTNTHSLSVLRDIYICMCINVVGYIQLHLSPFKHFVENFYSIVFFTLFYSLYYSILFYFLFRGFAGLLLLFECTCMHVGIFVCMCILLLFFWGGKEENEWKDKSFSYNSFKWIVNIALFIYINLIIKLVLG